MLKHVIRTYLLVKFVRLIVIIEFSSFASIAINLIYSKNQYLQKKSDPLSLIDPILSIYQCYSTSKNILYTIFKQKQKYLILGNAIIFFPLEKLLKYVQAFKICLSFIQLGLITYIKSQKSLNVLVQNIFLLSKFFLKHLSIHSQTLIICSDVHCNLHICQKEYYLFVINGFNAYNIQKITFKMQRRKGVTRKYLQVFGNNCKNQFTLYTASVELNSIKQQKIKIFPKPCTEAFIQIQINKVQKKEQSQKKTAYKIDKIKTIKQSLLDTLQRSFQYFQQEYESIDFDEQMYLLDE